MNIKTLPDGVMVTLPDCPDQAWLLWHGELHKWEPEGYSDKILANSVQDVAVITPISTVRAINAGYKPKVALGQSEKSPGSRRSILDFRIPEFECSECYLDSVSVVVRVQKPDSNRMRNILKYPLKTFGGVFGGITVFGRQF